MNKGQASNLNHSHIHIHKNGHIILCACGRAQICPERFAFDDFVRRDKHSMCRCGSKAAANATGAAAQYKRLKLKKTEVAIQTVQNQPLLLFWPKAAQTKTNENSSVCFQAAWHLRAPSLTADTRTRKTRHAKASSTSGTLSLHRLTAYQ